MVIKTDRSNESLGFLLGERSAFSHFSSAVALAKQGSSASFKQELGVWLSKLAQGVSGALVSPKIAGESLEGALLFLGLTLAQSPELYGRLRYYFADPDFLSISEGCDLYNALIGQLAKAIDYPELERLYLRVLSPVGEGERARASAYFGGTRCDLSCLSRCPYEEASGTWHPKLTIEFTAIDDPKAVARIALLDEGGKGRSKEYVVAMDYGGYVRREYTFDLQEPSLDSNRKATIGAEITFLRRESTLDEKGRALLRAKQEKKRLLIGVYLKDDGSKEKRNG